MELQVVLPDESPSMPARTMVDLARLAEELGYTTAWLPDHIIPPSEYGATFGGVYEPLVTIGHLTAVTERLRFGTSLLIAPLRNPFVLAKQVATLQQLSGGRMVLGVGVGWSEPEFDAVGAEFARRGAATDETLALLG
ncbi:MAG: LLM class flavin-dependent oxidoreductase, partial [Phycicoccus sp.]